MDLKSKMKMNACIKALEFIPKQGKVGLGSGSTVNMFAEIIPEESKAEFVCVSEKAAKTLKKKGLKVSVGTMHTDVAFDGADSIIGKGKKRIALKGAGALAFVDEKKIDYGSKKLYLLVDKGKIKSKKMGEVLVEVEKGLEHFFTERIGMFGYNVRKVPKNNPHLKGKKNSFFYIIIFGDENLNELEEHIECVKGVLGSGIFSRKKFTLIIGNKKGAKVS